MQELRHCARPDCAALFWVRSSKSLKVYCSTTCNHRMTKRRLAAQAKAEFGAAQVVAAARIRKGLGR